MSCHMADGGIRKDLECLLTKVLTTADGALVLRALQNRCRSYSKRAFFNSGSVVVGYTVLEEREVRKRGRRRPIDRLCGSFKG